MAINNIFKASVIFAGFSFFFVQPACCNNRIKTGIEVLEKNPGIIKGKKVGIITNCSALDSRMRSSIDIIYNIKTLEPVALYAPEHGIRGGKTGLIEDSRYETGIRVFSLHGKSKSPTAEMLREVDTLIFDLQDIGTRSYTFISTMKNCMQAAAKNNLAFIVLDRPNPLGGLLVEGPVLDMKFSSFIGAGPVAYLHGMTTGELALFFNRELGINCNLTVIPMEGWKRTMTWQDTGLVWTPTSPHIPEADTPFFYATTSILGELPFINIGVGYTLPFKIAGAPWIDAEKISEKLNTKNLPGVCFQPFYFTPFYHHYKDKFCKGFRIIIEDKKSFQPVATGYHIIETLRDMYPERFNLEKLSRYSTDMFNQSNGTDIILEMFRQKATAEEVIERYKDNLEDFKKKRKRYLLYD